jgi:hypothetical protein
MWPIWVTAVPSPAGPEYPFDEAAGEHHGDDAEGDGQDGHAAASALTQGVAQGDAQKVAVSGQTRAGCHISSARSFRRN